jgi:hypothetical protein
MWHSPFDLYYWMVTVLAGSMTMFLALAFLTIAGMTAMFRLPTMITALMFGLFIIMLSVYTGTFYLLVILIAALVIGWSVARLFR